jgi:hypothetical protein
LASPVSNRSAKRRRKPLLLRYWWIFLLLVAAAGGVLWLKDSPSSGRRAGPLPGYDTDVSSLDQEYARFQGQPLKDAQVRAQFQQAAGLSSQGDYRGALLLLEEVAKKAAVPVVFNDTGVLYAQLGDRARAIRAFRDALARDIGYAPVRRNLERLKGFTSNAADPVSAELEPNNNHELANVIAAGKDVEAEIAADHDVDVFKVSAPPAPRDLLAVHVENRSQTLVPRLSVYDADGTLLPWGKDQERPGESLTQILAPQPNATLYLHVFGRAASAGPYLLAVKALHAFDSFEPDDDIYSAAKIQPGQQVNANIMDENDTDFYAFVSPRTGMVAIDIKSSGGLVPALSTFTPDMRSSGFGPDIRTAGAPLHHTMPVQEGATYFLQVWSQAKSSGNYSLKVE